ncbi:MAG: adenine glycosylase [Actinomycetia bacterium]|nr:adenine glycosylase [Actinomycetes bacterium]
MSTRTTTIGVDRTRATARSGELAEWYAEHGRHDLPWRETRDRWAVLVSEVMLQQTQVARVLVAWPAFMRSFPTPEAAAAVPVGDLLRAWGRLGYPRRAKRLWEAAAIIAVRGWPDDLRELPGVGRYTAGALAAQADDLDVAALDVNVRRVLERVEGRSLTEGAAHEAMVDIGAPLRGRDRLLALMDVGAVLCRPRDPDCDACPLHDRCSTRGVRTDERRSRQPAFAGSFRQRRGVVMAELRAGPAPVGGLDAEALASLVADGLAIVAGPTAALP